MKNLIYSIPLSLFLFLGFLVDGPTLAYGNDSTMSNKFIKCMDMKHGDMLKCLQEETTESETSNDSDNVSKRYEAATTWQAPEEFTQTENPFVRDKDSLNIGKKAYSFYCSGCHGKKGLGNGEAINPFGRLAPSLVTAKVNEKTDGDLFWKITEGKWPMPAFWEGDFLSEDDLWHLINYVRSISFTAPKE